MGDTWYLQEISKIVVFFAWGVVIATHMPPLIRVVIAEAGTGEQIGVTDPVSSSRGADFEEDSKDTYLLGTVVELISDLTEGGVPIDEWRTTSEGAALRVDLTTELRV